MTTVIGEGATAHYGPSMPTRDDVQRLAAALERPRAGYVTRLEKARTALLPSCGTAARQLVLFIDRIADLTTEELGELHDETFRRDPATTVAPLATRLARRRTRPADAAAALDVLASWQDRLRTDRNPFEYLVGALCCVLRVRAGLATGAQRPGGMAGPPTP